MLMGVRMSNLCDKRKQHSKQNYGNIGLGHALGARVGVHVASRSVIRMTRRCLGH
jgi:hypothetical protein